MAKNYDFCGWATRNDLKCADGRTIRHNAFVEQDGKEVPLVWNHDHNDPDNVLGHALLENRDSGVYAYCTFNDTTHGQNAKELVKHGDVTALSIWANKLKQNGGDVLHGVIREVSLVLAGANPGAYIESVLAHGEESDSEAVIYTGEPLVLAHSDEDSSEESTKKDEEDTKVAKEQNENEKTVKDVIDSMTEEQKNVMYGLIAQALDEQPDEDDSDEEDDTDNEGEEDMKHNAFDGYDNEQDEILAHSADIAAAITDAKRYGSMKDSFIAHGIEDTTELMHGSYGIDQIDYLYPEDHNLNMPPKVIDNDNTWVSKVMGGVHHTPFSRIKSMFADYTAADLSARGYTKGKQKSLDAVFGLLKRSTTPTTIYKKQKMDRDDIIDITDMDVVAWLKQEMRTKLDEEIAKAILFGDGRMSGSDDKINEQCIRPVISDDDFYTIKFNVLDTAVNPDKTGVLATIGADAKYELFLNGAVRSRKKYKGAGTPTLFTTEDVFTELLLIKDANGRRIYNTAQELASAMRVKEIVTVPCMEGLTHTFGEDEDAEVMGVIINLSDYNVGADKGGAVNMFEDFDIDYNQQKYLIETRCSGALVTPYSAIVLYAKAK